MENKSVKKGKLFIVCGPSGVGKKTLISKILDKKYLNLDISISFTTRKKREGEKDGVDYFFVDKEEFLDNLRENRIVEYASFFNNYYGTPRNFVEEKLSKGRNVLLEVEVMGFKQILVRYPDAISIFIQSPTIDDLYLRLARRNTESVDKIIERVEKAKKELRDRYFFKYIITNRTVEEAASQLENLIFSEIE